MREVAAPEALRRAGKRSRYGRHAVIAIAVIFAVAGDGPIVGVPGKKIFETLIRGVRETQPDIDAGWSALLKKSPFYLSSHPARMHE